MRDGGEIVCLIKPQFEAGREKVGKNGVVREKEVHREVIEAIIGEMTQRGFQVLGLDFSLIKGPAGNIEYLLHLKNLRSDWREALTESKEGVVGVGENKEWLQAYSNEIETIVRQYHEMVL